MASSNQPEDHPNPSSRPSPPRSDPWLFTTQQQMIGSTSTFYDPETVSAGQDTHAYQNWLFTHGQAQQPQQQQNQMSAAATFHHQSQMLQGQYHFAPGQYSPPSGIASTDFPDTSIAITQADLSNTNRRSLHVGVPHQRPDLYFYPPSDLLPPDHSSYKQYNLNSPNGSTPASATSFMSPSSYTSSNLPTPGPVGNGPSYIPRSSARSATFAPSPDRLSLPSLSHHSHSNSSVSPTSWTEDGIISTPSSAASGHSRASAVPSSVQTAPSRPIIQTSNQTRSANTGNPLNSSKKAAKPPPAATATGRGKRKRQKKSDAADRDKDSDSGSDEEHDGFEAGGHSAVGGGTTSIGNPDPVVPTRLQGACTVCKRLKMKCDFPKDENTCKRCKAGGHVCVVEGRKPRTAPNKREYLLAQIRQKDAIIESLLKQLHNPYVATPLSIASYRMATSPSDQNNRNIVAWLDRLQSSLKPPQGKGGLSVFKVDPGPPRGSDTHIDDDSDDGSDHNAGASDDTKDFLNGGGDAEGSPTDPAKMQSLPDAAVPLGLIANLSLSNSKAKNGGKRKPRQEGDPANPDTEDDDDVGVANETYFMPGPATDLGIRASLIERHSPPEILVHGLVSPDDVDKLFDIFYTRVNPFVSLLDPVLHTPASTFARCPFLFTVICAISSRYFVERSEVYPIAMHFAKHSAANALIDGWKSVELCQAYILMSIYAVPAKRWEEDRSWLYTGLAIRIATDLNLHKVSPAKPQNERQEREILNRTRVWMICFNLDRSTATQFGKPVTIKEDYIMRNSKDWYKKSRYNISHDVHLCAYSSLLRIVARFHDDIFSDPDSVSGLNRQINFRTVTATHDEHLTRYHEEWSKIFAQESDPNDRSCAFRCTLLPFLVNYSRLVMYSFGFQQAFQRGIEPDDHVFFTKCLEAAKSVLKNMIEVLAPSGYMRYAPDGHYIFASFASAFLLKLLRLDFSNMLSKEQESEIFDLIGRLIQTFSSPEIAIDDRHTPRLYARFLAGLLSRHRREGGNAGRHHQQPPPPNPIPVPSEDDITPTKATTTTFAMPQPQNSGTQTHESVYTQSLFNQSEKSDTPTYANGAAFVTSTTPIGFDMSGDFGMDLGIGNGLSEEEMLATMQALQNPAWWKDVMMPGFSWPDHSPMLNNGGGFYNQNMGMHTGFGFLPTEVPL